MNEATPYRGKAMTRAPVHCQDCRYWNDYIDDMHGRVQHCFKRVEDPSRGINPINGKPYLKMLNYKESNKDLDCVYYEHKPSLWERMKRWWVKQWWANK